MNPTLPDGWHRLSISQIATFTSGDLISVAKLSEQSPSRPVPVFGGNGVAGYTSSAMVDEPTVILGRVGQKCGVVFRNTGPAWITDNALYARRFKRPLDVRFLAFALEAARLNDLKNRNDLPLITQSILHDVKVAWPDSLEEQRYIADTLSDAERLVATIEDLITKKQAIKQGMMQQLLTGRTRLSGFTEPWSVTTISEACTMLSGGTPDRANPGYWTGTVPWISAATLKRTHVDDSDQRISEAAVRTGSKLAPQGSTLVLVRGMALHRELRVGIAMRPVAFNQDVKALVPRSCLVSEYLTYSLLAQRSRILDLVSSAGSGTGVLDTGLLKRLPIHLPGRTEQQRIVCTMNDAHREVEVLERRLVKAKAIKQGMMQQLLTGRTRLPVLEP